MKFSLRPALLHHTEEEVRENVLNPPRKQNIHLANRQSNHLDKACPVGRNRIRIAIAAAVAVVTAVLVVVADTVMMKIIRLWSVVEAKLAAMTILIRIIPTTMKKQIVNWPNFCKMSPPISLCTIK